MLRRLVIVVLVSVALSSRTYGEQDPVSDDDLEKLPPVLFGVDEHGHVLPSLGGSTEKPLLGRPDGHDGNREDLIGRPDGHDGNREDLIGRPDGHDGNWEDLIGKPDGHDTWKEDSSRLSGEKEVIHEEWEDGDPEYGDTEYEDEPLVRCKRPLCDMACEFGFQTDSTGCPICKCLEDPCQGVQCDDGTICQPVSCDVGRSCVELTHRCQRNMQCPIPMCANHCPDGYAYNANGCMMCTCKGSAPPKPSDIADKPLICPGPEPMCATFCQNGYKKDSRGCMTCDCNEEEPDDIQCGMQKCTVGQVCRSTDGYIEYGSADSSAVCAPKPLCHIAQDMAFMKRNLQEKNSTRMFVPECNDDANFKPRQCNYLVSECWCVDDRGKELEGTRTPISDDGINLQCSPHLTTAVLIEMILISDDDEEDDDGDESDDDEDDFPQASVLHHTLQHAVSSWMLIEEQYVTVLKAEQNSESGKGNINVWMKIAKSDSVDLPSAIEHMKRKLRMGDGSIPLDDDVFIPDMDSLNIKHQYESDETVTPAMAESAENDIVSWYKNCFRNYPFWLASTVFVVLLLILAFFTVMMVHHRRKYSRSLQFRHHILDNQYSHEHKGFVDGEVASNNLNESSVILMNADALEKKQPIA